jgi:hypothetical protein
MCFEERTDLRLEQPLSKSITKSIGNFFLSIMPDSFLQIDRAFPTRWCDTLLSHAFLILDFQL